MVLHFGGCRWTEPISLRELTVVPAGRPGANPEWEPPLWDLAALTPEAMLAVDGVWQPVLAVVRTLEGASPKWRGVYRQAVQRVLALPEAERVLRSDLLWYALSYVSRRRGSVEAREMMTITQELAPNATLLDDMRAVCESVERSWFEEMHHQGLQQGLQEGEQRGPLHTLRLALSTVLETRFGSLPRSVAEAIERCTDTQRLQEALPTATRVTTLAEFHL